ncbi:hypothetical protein LTR91_022297 [Friedmanniomyces endolithicus]|uniref:Nucleic acid-binding protein n=1 Tax=Friedmanniomyces endolithicus TaxID=329885 RepID=A0AAN6H560_9PEZI|nr:hypothetical protein LTR94_012680 [Friedmanniomyces endolithicus]KAK0792039.1 hypothetical protein LTR38_009991 [Friedmanniomyces endolithicus]KAK0800698.1 hypothetical protein LTR59_005603 [Friedmanniomyces endolithicus]KAK0849735.1 hypothetical protein LTS02_013475 [Friedmanniomyces endolithicus]KAK0849780.1 hypothetical protein LTR03_004966 [Friedmanniomyces endolithicus]
MSRRAVTLPLRLASAPKQQPQQWTCRRCLATQATSTTSTPSDSTSPPPPGYGDPRLPASARIDPATGRPTPLSEVDRLLKKPLRQLIPPQYLEHSTVEWLHENERAQREKTRVHRKIVGVVVSTGKMAKTVKVRVPTQRWEAKIGKYFADHTNHLVHDPNDSLVLGDVIELHRLRVSKAVHHVVGELITPFGIPLSERPAIPTADDRLAAYKKKRFAKLGRRELRREAAKGDVEALLKLKAMGLVETGTGKKADGKGALVGQKRMKGVLAGRKRSEEPAPGSKEKVQRLAEKAEANALEAEKLEKVDLTADSLSSTTMERGREG